MTAERCECGHLTDHHFAGVGRCVWNRDMLEGADGCEHYQPASEPKEAEITDAP